MAGIMVLPPAAWAYLKPGHARVATSPAPLPLEEYVANTILNARVFRDAPQNDPVPPSEAGYLDGAKLYREYCADCRGLGGAQKTSIAAGMFPKPPRLFQVKGVTDYHMWRMAKLPASVQEELKRSDSFMAVR